MELGLYIHLPFCPSLCPYCDFNSGVYDAALASRLLPAMLRHLGNAAPAARGRRLASVYFGGGTPSMLKAAHLAGLLHAARGLMGFEPDAEISLEANPGTCGGAKLAALAEAGFNRLSLGAQSFDRAMLKTLGRRHSPEQTANAARRAREAGFKSLSLDLIYALPGQGRQGLARDIARALELEPDHISLYELTLGPETPFGRVYEKGAAPLPSDDEVPAMERAAYAQLGRAGLHRYEVSNFARPGHKCRHNLSTWRGGDYLAIGPGAHGHLAGLRWANIPGAAGYARAMEQGAEPLAFSETLSPGQRALELVMLGLRTVEGVDLMRAGEVLGCDARVFWQKEINELHRLNWADLRDSRLRPTALGLSMADSAAALFV